MATAQGEFGSESEAARAIDALVEAGIPRGRIQRWNVIPERGPEAPQRSSAGRSALVGYVFGGVTGAVLGGGLGAARDALTDTHTPMPEVSGVRVVVELADADADAREILRRHGATNVR